ncbi:MAG: hypothetical protein CSA75_04205, partial [Sorangium cellulosum]
LVTNGGLLKRTNRFTSRDISPLPRRAPPIHYRAGGGFLEVGMSHTSNQRREAKKGGPTNASVVSRLSKAISAAGVIAAIAITLLVNVVSARHYKRWDFTSSQLYTLSAATLSTLHSLEQTVTIEVLLSSGDPLQGSIKNLVERYGAETTRLSIRFVDPDRYPAEFVAVQQKYGIVAGRTEDGRVVTDAAIILASRDRHWFITPDDLVDFSDIDDGKTKSKLEQSITEGIRAVVGGEQRRICFSSGHGEFSIDDNSPRGLGELRDRLQKNNYEPVTLGDKGSKFGYSLEKCEVLAVIGPEVPFSKAEADAIEKRMQEGMSGIFMLNPILDAEKKVQLKTGLEKVTERFGIGITNDYVFELDDDARVPRGTGEVFFATLEPHPMTDGLASVSLALEGLRIVIIRSRSLHSVGGQVQPTTILATSPLAFGMMNFYDWVDKGGDPVKEANDRSGPLSVGMAAELPIDKDAKQPHGARLVVLGTANLALGQNWRDLSLRGNAVLMGNIMSWVASKPPIVDIPPKITPAATLRVSEKSLNEILRYVLIFMPGAATLLGVAVHLRRRSRDDRRPVKNRTPNDDHSQRAP